MRQRLVTYRKAVFVCTNVRADGRVACANPGRGGDVVCKLLKEEVKKGGTTMKNDFRRTTFLPLILLAFNATYAVAAPESPSGASQKQAAAPKRASAAGKKQTASSSARHLGGILRVGEDIEVRGADSVEGPVIAVKGSVTVAGKVDGPVVALGGSVRLQPGSAVDGPAIALGGSARAEEGSTLDGPLLELPGGILGWRRLGLLISAFAGLTGGFWLAYKIIGTLGWIALATLAAILFPKALETSRASLERRPGVAALTGFLFWPSLGIVCLTLLVSLVGIPILPFAILAAACVWGWGFTIIAAYLGRELLRGSNPPLCVLVGAVILRALHWVPFVHLAACLAVAILGVGAAVTSRFGSKAANAASPAP